MDPMQEWVLRLTLLVDMVYHRDIRMGSSLRVSCFDYERRVDYRDRPEMTFDAGSGLWD